MPEKSIEELEEMVGETYTVVERFPLERGKIAEFAESIKEDDPMYTDTTAETARERGYDDVPIPLTYPRVVAFFRARQDTEGRPDLTFDRERGLHGEQSYEYERVPVAGEVLSAEGELSAVYQRDGARGGTMTFAEFEETYYDEDGEVVFTVGSTSIETGRAPAGED